jgi:type III secretory pathway component EscR
VAVTFPQTGLEADEEIVQTAGLDGAAACGISLGVSVGVDRIAVPTWQVLWNLVLHNITLVLVIFISVAVIFAVSSKR